MFSHAEGYFWWEFQQNAFFMTFLSAYDEFNNSYHTQSCRFDVIDLLTFRHQLFSNFKMISSAISNPINPKLIHYSVKIAHFFFKNLHHQSICQSGQSNLTSSSNSRTSATKLKVHDAIRASMVRHTAQHITNTATTTDHAQTSQLRSFHRFLPD